MKQATLNLDLHCKKTRKREFLEEMEQVVPWAKLVTLIARTTPKRRDGRPPFALETMQRTHFIQQWFSLSDPAMEDAFFEGELGSDTNPPTFLTTASGGMPLQNSGAAG